jgi:heat shock protein HslJ
MSVPARLFVSLCLCAAPATAQDAVVWQLTHLNGAAFTARATLTYLPDGTVQGQGPCNTYAGQLVAPPPAWALGPLRTTRIACDDLQAETAFFAAMAAMTAVNQTTDRLTLSGPDGAVMVFVPNGT